MSRKYLGFFSENNLTMADNGSIKQHIVKEVNYDKNKIISYLNKGKKEATCPKVVKDILTDKLISTSFSVFTDGEYVWKSDFIHYIENYNIKLPEDFIAKASA